MNVSEFTALSQKVILHSRNGEKVKFSVSTL